MEYVKAVERYGLHYADVQELARNSLEYSFLPGAGLYQHHDYSRPRAEFESVRDRNWQPTAAARRLMRVDEKLRRQVHLERAMVEFEQYLEAGFAERRP
jgi:adenosine deaminase